MMVTRRNLLRLTATAAVLPVSLFMSGCPFSAAGVLAALERYIPLGLQAFAGIVALINPPAGSAINTAVLIAKALWTDVQEAIATYNAAPAADKTTLLGRVDTGLQALLNGLTRLLSSLGLHSQTDQQTAVAALMLLIAVLSGIQAELPLPSAPAARARRAALPARFNIGAQQVEIVGDPKKFKEQYNAIMRAGGHAQLQLAGKWKLNKT